MFLMTFWDDLLLICSNLLLSDGLGTHTSSPYCLLERLGLSRGPLAHIGLSDVDDVIHGLCCGGLQLTWVRTEGTVRQI